MNQDPEAPPPPEEPAAPPPRDTVSRDRQKADLLQKFFEEDTPGERDLERSEIREGPPPLPGPQGARDEPAPVATEDAGVPGLGARPPASGRERRPERRPPDVRRPGGRDPRGGRHGPPPGQGRDRGRKDRPAPREEAPAAQERERLRGALSTADARIRNMQREIDVLRNRLRALAVPPGPAAPPAVRQPSRTAAAPTPEPAGHPGALPDQRVALLLDFPGLLAFAQKRGRSVSAEEILRGVVRGRRLVRAVAYGAPGTGEELASLLEHAGFEILAGEGSRSAAAADLRTLSARVDSVVAAGFDDSLEGPLREARESGARTEVAGFEPNDAPGLAGVAHAFLRLGEERPPRPRG